MGNSRRRPDTLWVAAFARILLVGIGLAGSAPDALRAAPAVPAQTTPGAPGTPAPSSAATQEAPAGERLLLSLDQAVRRALEQNPTLAEAEAAIRRAEAVVAEARSFQRPRLDAQAQFTLQGPIPSFTFTTPPAQPGEPPVTREIAFGRTFTRSFAVTGTVDPDPFGRLRAQRRAAERQVNVSRGGYFTAQNELVFAVQNVYLAALRARELIGVQQEALEAAREQLRVAEAQFRAGTAPEFDVLRARVQVENVRQNLVAAEATYDRTVATLARLLSLEPGVRPELVPVTVPPETEAVAGAAARELLEPAGPVPPTLEAALAEAFRQRPEVYRAEWARRAAEARVEFERKGRLPSLTLAAAGFHNPDATGLAAIETSWSIVANVAIPIWDAGLARARTRQAQADVAAAAAQEEASRDVVAEEVKRALADLRDAEERRRTAEANVEQAREALRIARVRYSAGLAPNVEVTDAEAALTLARANAVNAAYDYLTALASVNRSLGRYATETLARVRSPAP